MQADSTFLILIFAGLSLAGIVGVTIIHRRATRPHSSLPHEVRVKSHEVKNNVTAIRGGLNRIKREPNPLAYLVKAIEGKNGDTIGD